MVRLLVARQAYRSIVDRSYLYDSLGREERTPKRHSPLLDTLIKLGQLHQPDARAVIAYADRFAADPGSNAPPDTTLSGKFADLLERLVAGSAALPGEQRIARLVAANLLLGHSAPLGWANESGAEPIRRQLAQAGAYLEDNHMAGGWIAPDTWLWKAFDLRSAGLASERVYLMALLTGLDRSSGSDCDIADQFRSVIASAPEWLATHPHSPYVADVYLALAEAYTDIVALGAGATFGGMPEDAAKYQPESRRARLRAIQYFRKAFALKPYLASQGDDWEDAWRLAAGLAPTQTRFYCINE